VGEVFVALLDPDPRNNGRGVALLEAAGVRVTLGLLEAEARHDLAPHLALKENRP
jgi:pyrimidine deaminase RibD-like protein